MVAEALAKASNQSGSELVKLAGTLKPSEPTLTFQPGEPLLLERNIIAGVFAISRITGTYHATSYNAAPFAFKPSQRCSDLNLRVNPALLNV